MELCNRFEGRIHTKERKSISFVQRGERESKRVHSEVDEEEIHKTIKITTNSPCALCRKKEWEEEDSVRLLIFE